MDDYCFGVGDQSLVVIFKVAVLEHLALHRQLDLRAREAGGQLFGRIDPAGFVIEHATGPRRTDWRSRFGFHPDRAAEQREIKLLFEEGLHFLGDWHTHPEDRAKASRDDIRAMGDQFARSKHELPAFLMVIVGRLQVPDGMWVSLHYRDDAWVRLHLDETTPI